MHFLQNSNFWVPIKWSNKINTIFHKACWIFLFDKFHIGYFAMFTGHPFCFGGLTLRFRCCSSLQAGYLNDLILYRACASPHNAMQRVTLSRVDRENNFQKKQFQGFSNSGLPVEYNTSYRIYFYIVVFHFLHVHVLARFDQGNFHHSYFAPSWVSLSILHVLP